MHIMLYKQSFDTFIRIYDGVGYVTNRASFSDRACNESGAVFLSVLSREPQTFETLLDKAVEKFDSVTVEEIRPHAEEFYRQLEEDNFIVSAETVEEVEEKDAKNRFSYNSLKPKTIVNDFTPAIPRAEKSTQVFLEDHFVDNPHLMNFQIELTSRCNERCVHCYIPHENKINDITPELFDSVLEQCKEMGVLTLTFSGGEPLLHPNFLEFLRKAKEYDFAISVLSNLTLLNDEIVKEMRSTRISSVQVSLYSMNPEIHDKITTVAGSWQKTHDAILKLVENDIPVQISCPIMKENKNSLSDVMMWGEKLKVRVITDYTIMARYDHSVGNLEHRLSIDEGEEILKDMLAADKDYQNQILKAVNSNKAEYVHDGSERLCGVCQTSICMISNGNIYPCAGWQDYICGNLNEQSLQEIWKNSPKTNYVRNIKYKDFPKCLKCEFQNHCIVCLVRNANESPTGNPLEVPPHLCEVAKRTKKVVEQWIKNNTVYAYMSADDLDSGLDGNGVQDDGEGECIGRKLIVNNDGQIEIIPIYKPKDKTTSTTGGN